MDGLANPKEVGYPQVRDEGWPAALKGHGIILINGDKDSCVSCPAGELRRFCSPQPYKYLWQQVFYGKYAIMWSESEAS